MNIPIIPAVAMVFGITSAITSLAMFFLVLWQAPRNRDNQLMAFYMVTVIVWGLSVFAGHFLGLLGQTIPSDWVVYSVVLARSFNALFLFALVTHYVGLWRNRWVQGILFASVGYRFLIVIPLLFQGQLYNQFVLLPSGQTSFHIESLGYILLFINNLYYLATLAVLWVFRHQRTKQLLVGTIILLVGVLITPTQLRVYSPVIINAAIAGIFFTYAILQENLFNPLVKLNEALQESEEKYRSLTNQLPIGVYRTSRDGEIVYANPALAIILGYEKVEDLIKTSAADAYVDPDQRNKQLGQWKTSGGVIGSEVKLRTKDGKEIWVRDTGRVILDESGEIDYVDGTIEDITERKHTEQALQEAEQRLRTVIDYAPIVLFALDREGNITLSEGKGLEALGLKPDQMIGQSIFDLYADSTPILESVHAALANEAGTSTIEVDGLTFDIWYEPLCNQNKQVVGVVGAALDVTWRKQAEQTLQQTNAKLQQRIHELGTLNRITQAVATVTDLQSALELVAQEITHCFNGFSTGISLFNEARTERTIVVLYQVQDQDKLDLVGRVIPITDGMTYAEYIGRGKPLVIPDPQTSPYTRASHKSIQERNLQCLMLIPLQSRGEIIGTISVSTNQVGREFISTEVRLAETIAGQIAGAIENARLYTEAQQEIAERKRAQEALAQARDQALEASRLKSELLAKVSHELRTPLGVILGYAELLEDGTFGSLSEQQQEITVKVIDSARYLSNLVNELLDQAQFERGKLELVIKPFAPKDLIRQVETKMNVLAQAKGLSLSHDIAVHVPPILSGDPYRLQQVLVNLVSNAIKFTDTGEVTVRFSCPDPEHWAMQVTDTGSGIPPEAQAYIFEPFRQVDGSMTREHSGTGLGLSIVKQLTTLMGGQVTLESQLGQGSTFTILLPLTPIQEKKV